MTSSVVQAHRSHRGRTRKGRSNPSKDSLLITGARIARNGREAAPAALLIRNGRIESVLPGSANVGCLSLDPTTARLDLTGCLILPGLINAHDHLEFSLFPRLGNRIYSNAQEWAEDIYHPKQSPIRELLRVPKTVRLLFGGIRNLLSGVTTVCHHNPYEKVFDGDFPVRVVRRMGWSHSLAFSRSVRADFEQTPVGAPFLIHAGEGTDGTSRTEVHELERLGLLGPQTVLIHAVAFNDPEWDIIRRRNTRFIWCPGSNLFTLGKTISGHRLTGEVEFALGSDSALTVEGDLLDQVHLAKSLGLPPARIYDCVTISGASVLGLTDREGELSEGGVADCFVLRDDGGSPAEQLAHLRRQDMVGVMRGGRWVLRSDLLHQQVPPSSSHLPVSYRNCRWWLSDYPGLGNHLRFAACRSDRSIQLASHQLVVDPQRSSVPLPAISWRDD
ncbi:MAG: amidohydrolase family protein [Acidobacteriota bacterium]